MNVELLSKLARYKDTFPPTHLPLGADDVSESSQDVSPPKFASTGTDSVCSRVGK